MSFDLQIPLDRVTWRDGQRLAARDMNDEARHMYRLRRLHNMYMHGASSGNWGIVAGFETALLAGGATVAVKQGYAIDFSGRELILSRNVVVPVPSAASGWVVLVIRYQEQKVYCGRTAKAGCEHSALGPQGEFPAFVWIAPEELNAGADIPLAAMQVSGGAAVAPLNLSVRRNARRTDGYRLASDVTTAFDTVWRRSDDKQAWIETAVDTGGAGFIRTPLYFADLRRPDGVIVTGLGAGAVFVTDPWARGFKLRALIGLGQLGLPVSAKEANAKGWTVSWLGFEPESVPPVTPPKYVHLSGFELMTVELFK